MATKVDNEKSDSINTNDMNKAKKHSQPNDALDHLDDEDCGPPLLCPQTVCSDNTVLVFLEPRVDEHGVIHGISAVICSGQHSAPKGALTGARVAFDGDLVRHAFTSGDDDFKEILKEQYPADTLWMSFLRHHVATKAASRTGAGGPVTAHAVVDSFPLVTAESGLQPLLRHWSQRLSYHCPDVTVADRVV